MTDPPFSPARLAARWGCTRQLVYKLIKDGRLGHCKIGKLVRIPEPAVRRYELLRDSAASPAVMRHVTTIQAVINAHPRDNGYVYFMRCREILKIGWSSQPLSRRAELQAVIPFEIEVLGYVASCRQAEAAMHAAFASVKYPLLKEWFYLSDDLLAAIVTVTKDAGNG